MLPAGMYMNTQLPQQVSSQGPDRRGDCLLYCNVHMQFNLVTSSIKFHYDDLAILAVGVPNCCKTVLELFGFCRVVCV
jgi:hypothetical protein